MPSAFTARASSRNAGFRGRAVGGLLAAVVVATAFACGTDPVGVDACKRIERVRCESAQACGISLASPVHEGDSPERNVAACIRYYDDQCLHGLAVPKEPATADVDRCVDAIINGDCSVVKTPQDHPSCAFLVPPAPVAAAPAVDAASSDAGAQDATTD